MVFLVLRQKKNLYVYLIDLPKLATNFCVLLKNPVLIYTIELSILHVWDSEVLIKSHNKSVQILLYPKIAFINHIN